MSWDRWFVLGWAPHPQWFQWLNPGLVALSVGVAVATSMMAMQIAGLARDAASPRVRSIGVLTGAFCLGAGIWAMHFIGMLAFLPCTFGEYDPWITALSMLPSMLASWLALTLMVRPQLSRKGLVGGGVLMGLGIGSMHYIGMAAAQTWAWMLYDPWGVLLSVGVAATMAMLSLWVRFHIGQTGRRLWPTLVAGSVMGLAISCMHYAGLYALRLKPEIDVLAQLESPTQGLLVFSIVGVVALIFGLVFALNMTLRYRQIYQQVLGSESRLRAVVETAVDGIITIDGQGRIVSFNGAAERLLGWSAEEVMGRNVSMLMPEPDRGAHDGYLEHHLRTGMTSVIGSGRDVQALHKNGSQIAVRLAVGRVNHPGNPLFVGFLTDIRERRQMLQSLRDSEEQYRTLINNVPGTTFRCLHDGKWSPLLLSRSVEALTGWTEQDFLEDRTGWDRLIHTEDREHLETAVAHALGRRQTYEAEYRLQHRDGSIRWVSETGRGVFNERGELTWVDGVIMDQTAARARNAEFEGTVRAIDLSLATIEYDPQGHVLRANRNFLDLFGYRLDEVVGHHHGMFCEPDYAHTPEHLQFWRRLADGEFQAGEFLRCGREGRRIWVQATYNPILDAHGRPYKIVKLLTDISAQRKMAQELVLAKEHAEAAAAARSTFLANMSHEIRTPMNAIIGFTEALRETALQPTQARYLDTVHYAARSMLRLLNDILDTAKLDKGAVELEIEDFSVRELCQQILASLRITADRKGLDLRLDYDPHTPAALRGDGMRVQQILVNLLGNAVKFTERGHVLLRVRYEQGVLLLDVHDTGIGIAPEKIQRIFDPFAQADASTTRRFGGTGLGTTISRQLAELMGGSIQLHSTVGVGTVFEVRLPLPPGEAVLPERGAASRGLPPLIILAVDDVPENLELLQINFSSQQHRIVLAHDGAEALRCVQAQEPPFDVVLMDLQMPGMDGLAAARAIRVWERQLQRRPVPIVALSASVLEKDRSDASAAGMDGFAAKPLDMVRLQAEIARLLSLQVALKDAKPPVPAGSQAGLPDVTVDWASGLALWGRVEPLVAAIRRFLNEQLDLADRLRRAQQRPGPEALVGLAHRVRGAAGNLGLQAVYRLASGLETQAQEEAEPQVLLAAIDQLQQALDAVTQELRQRYPAALQAVDGQGLAAPVPSAATGRAPASAVAAELPEEARPWLDRIVAALQSGELDTQAMQAMLRIVPGAQLQGLQQALDNFDFERAQDCAQQLQRQLPSVDGVRA
ncbi:MAG: PAS domain S-box protein [Burkholderiaceae bacterium]|jgi:PAS domain S-box-containing protein|nr:PAS domain S-box protein [Burkholderiaceae bacterium]